MSRFPARTAAAVVLLVATVPCAAAVVEARVVDAAGHPVADAAVWAVPSGPVPEPRARAVAEPKRTVAIEQVEREFVPHVTVIQSGTVASFPNRDQILHHVYSFSPAKAFEIKLYTGKSPHEVTFDKPGIVTLGCNIHDWMLGYVVVVPTPYFAKSDATGAVRLRDLPPGAYEVRAWQPQQRAALAPQALTLDSGSTTPVTFQFDLVPRKAKYKAPLDRLKY